MRVKVTVLFWGKFSDKKGMMPHADTRLERFAVLGKVVSPPKLHGSKYSMIIE